MPAQPSFPAAHTVPDEPAEADKKDLPAESSIASHLTGILALPLLARKTAGDRERDFRAHRAATEAANQAAAAIFATNAPGQKAILMVKYD